MVRLPILGILSAALLVAQTPVPQNVDSSLFDWFRTNGSGASGDLSGAGPGKVISFTPGPRGISTSTPVWISEGSGTAEAVTPSSTTCNVGSVTSSCSITVTTSNAHSGAWRVGSVASGIPEAIGIARAGKLKTVFVPPGIVSVHDPIFIGAGVTLQGSGAGVTILRGDNSVSAVLQLGSATVMAERSFVNDLTVDRLGTPPAESVGILWRWFHYSGVERVRVTNQAIGHRFDYKDSSSVSLGAILTNVQVDRCTESYAYVNRAVDVKFIGGEFGVNGSSSGDGPENVLVVANNSDTVQFIGTGIIPRQSSDRLIDFRNYSGVGVIRFDTCNIEEVGGLVRSDSATASIYELQLVNVRFASSGGAMFALDSATTLYGLKVSASAIAGQFNLPKGLWTTISGNHFGPGNYTFSGGSGSTSSLSFTGNTVSGNLTLDGTWASLTVAGNTFYSTVLTNSATATSMQIGPNSTNNATPIVNSFGYTRMSGYLVPQTIVRSFIPTLSDSFYPNGSIFWCSDCADDGSSCSAGSGASVQKRNGSAFCF
jgi:hypothetical protein